MRCKGLDHQTMAAKLEKWSGSWQREKITDCITIWRRKNRMKRSVAYAIAIAGETWSLKPTGMDGMDDHDLFIKQHCWSPPLEGYLQNSSHYTSVLYSSTEFLPGAYLSIPAPFQSMISLGFLSSSFLPLFLPSSKCFNSFCNVPSCSHNVA